MPASKREQLAMAALTAGCLLLSLAFFIPDAPMPQALHVSVLGPTDGPFGSPMALVRVTNNTGHAREFYLAAEVATPTGWADARGWVERQSGRMQRIASHGACRPMVPPPEGAVKWRLRCVSIPEVSRFEGTWYMLVRRGGLRRLGFREDPPGSYAWTAQVTQ